VVHVMMVMVVVMVVVVVMMVMVHRLRHRGRLGRSGRHRPRSGFLRDCVAGDPNGENGGGDKALNHGRSILSKKTPAVFGAHFAVA